MVDTIRLLSALQILHADNDTGDVSNQDVRDLLVSVYPDVNTDTLTGTHVLAFTDKAIQVLDCDGVARDVTLPAEADSTAKSFVVINATSAAHDLTVKDDGGSTIGTVSQGECKKFVCSGAAWYLLS